MRDHSKEATARRRAERAGRLREELDRMLVLLKGHPGVVKVVLFGSLARGAPGARSDLDLVIVQRTDKRFTARLDEFYRSLDPRVATDILVYTPAEWADAAARPFIRQARREGRVLHDAGAAIGPAGG